MRDRVSGQEVPAAAVHKYLTDASGRPLEFPRILDELCPACATAAKPTALAIYSENPPATETVHCTNCDYMLARRPKLERVVRPMNSGPARG